MPGKYSKLPPGNWLGLDEPGDTREYVLYWWFLYRARAKIVVFLTSISKGRSFTSRVHNRCEEIVATVRVVCEPPELRTRKITRNVHLYVCGTVT